MSVREDLILDITGAQRSVDQLETQLTKVTGASVEVLVDVDEAIAQVRSIEERLAGLDAADRDVVVRASIDQAQAEIRALERQLGSGTLSDQEIRILIDQRNEASRKLGQLRGEIAEVAKEAKGIQLGLGDVALTGGAFAGLSRITLEAAEAEQAIGGLESIFGTATAGVEAFVSEADQLAGLSELAARQLTGRLGASLKGAGFELDDAAAKSVELTRIGADLAATMGGTTAEAVGALGGALRGEFESLEMFGITLTQTQVDARAVALGLADSVSSVDAASRAQATYALILERSADAQGQFVREIETASGQAAVSAAQRADAAVELGENLLPLYTQLSQAAGVAAEVVGVLPGPVQILGLSILGLGAVARPAKAGIELISDATGRLRDGVRGADGGVAGLTGRFAGMATQIGLVIGAGQILSSVLHDLETADLTQLENALLDISTGVVGGEAASAFGEDLGGLSDAIERITAPSVQTQVANTINYLGDLGGALGRTTDLDQAEQTIDDLDKALASLASRDPAQASAALDAILGEIPAGADRLVPLLDDYETALAGVDTTNRTAAGTTGDVTEKLSLQDQVLKDVTESLDLFREGMEEAFAPLSLEAAIDRRSQALADIGEGISDRARALQDARGRLAELQGLDVDERPEDFARQVADAQAAIREATAATSLALDGDTEAARRNREEIAGVADDIGEVITKHRDVGASLEELQVIRDLEILNLEKQLTTMGFSREEISRYIEVIDAIPITAGTVVTVETARAEADIKRFRERVQREIDLNPFSIDVLQTEKFPRRHSGGPVFAGEMYVTGGHGAEELFVAPRDGTILSPSATRQFLSQVPAFGMRDFATGGAAGGRLHPDDIAALAQAIVGATPRGITANYTLDGTKRAADIARESTAHLKAIERRSKR